MKRWFPLVVLLTVGAGSLLAETAQEIYARGVRAYTGGNIEQAEALFQQALAVNPNMKSAQAYLKRIQVTKPPSNTLRKRVEETIVPSVDFKDASLSSVLEYLPKVAAENSPDKGPVNIVQLIPPDYGKNTMITLQLSNVPLSSVLDYVAQMGGVKLDYQSNAIVVSQAATVSAQ